MRTRMTSWVGGFTPPSWRTARTGTRRRGPAPTTCRAGVLPGRPRTPVGAPPEGSAPTTSPRGSRGSARGGDVGVRVGLEVQHPVAPAAAPVDHARAVRVRVVEEEEVVSDELHLVDRVLERQ